MRGELFAFRAANPRERIERTREGAIELLGGIGLIEARWGIGLKVEPIEGHLPCVLAPPFGGEHALIYGDMASKPTEAVEIRGGSREPMEDAGGIAGKMVTLEDVERLGCGAHGVDGEHAPLARVVRAGGDDAVEGGELGVSRARMSGGEVKADFADKIP